MGSAWEGHASLPDEEVAEDADGVVAVGLVGWSRCLWPSTTAGLHVLA